MPFLLVTYDFDLDQADSHIGHEGRRQAPHSLLQEYLNTEDTALWGIVANGTNLRILRDNASLTRPAYIEADLNLIFSEELYSDFAVLWLTAHASRLRPIDDMPSNCIIESWRTKAHETGERVRENLRDGVTESLRQLGNGFLQNSSNASLLESLKGGTLSPIDYFQQLLRLVYRLLFLFSSEDRDLLHEPSATAEQRTIYDEGYALSRLREKARYRRNYDNNSDLWCGLQVTFRSLAEGAGGLGIPPLGGLFRADQCPNLDVSNVSNEFLLEAIRNLAFFISDKMLTRVNYRDMDTEELGSVYESLLELWPMIKVDSSTLTFTFAGDGNNENVKGSQRKLTGSYYTPPSLVSELIDSTLNPIISQSISDNPKDPKSAILRLRIVDPACGSGHFLLAAARRLAAEITRIESENNSTNEVTQQRALREVVQHCIYGVDRNTLAVELCKTALWMETVEPGKPLTFLDAHILHGDSLMGILDPEIMASGIPKEAYKHLTGDNKNVCQDLKKRNQQPNQPELFDQDAFLEVAVSNIDLETMPENTLVEVERKRAAWNANLTNKHQSREALRANLFLAAFFAPKTSQHREKLPHTQDLYRIDDGHRQRLGVEGLVQRIAKNHCFFHWHLAFAEIMQDGGFDAVLGNPPWERIKLQEREFFALRSPEIANASNKAERDRLIQQLNRDDALPAEKSLYLELQIAKHDSEAASQYARVGGRFPLTGVGDLNTYPLFAETFLNLLNSRGRAGLIVPTGIAVDHSTRHYFQHVISRKRLISLFDFENREKVFPGIDSRIKFCLITLAGKDSQVPESEFAFFLHKTEHLKEKERRYTLSIEDFSLFNPNTRTCPMFRTQRDMDIARKMYKCAGVFWTEARDHQLEDNPWGAEFSRMFDMSNDSKLFRTREDLTNEGWELKGNVFIRGNKRYLPLYEAKLIHQYDHRFATFDGVSEQEIRSGNAREMTKGEKLDPNSVAIPRYWVPESDVFTRLDMSEPSRAEPSRAEPSRAIIFDTLIQLAHKSLSDRLPTQQTRGQESLL